MASLGLLLLFHHNLHYLDGSEISGSIEPTHLYKYNIKRKPKQHKTVTSAVVNQVRRSLLSGEQSAAKYPGVTHQR